MAAEQFVKMIDGTFSYFEMLAKQKQDPASVDAVRRIVAGSGAFGFTRTLFAGMPT